MNNPFNTSSSYFSNEAILNRIGGNVLAWKENQKEENVQPDSQEAEEEPPLEE